MQDLATRLFFLMLGPRPLVAPVANFFWIKRVSDNLSWATEDSTSRHASEVPRQVAAVPAWTSKVHKRTAFIP